MKHPIFLALSLLLPISASAAFDLEGEVLCETQSGRKIRLNDGLLGGKGLAMESQRPGKVLRATLRSVKGGVASFGIDNGPRARSPYFDLRLDLNRAEATSRQEGPDVVLYYYVPALLETTKVSLFSGAQTETEEGKCLQAVR